MRRASCGGLAILTGLACSLLSACGLAADALLVVSNKSGNAEIYLHEGDGDPTNLTNNPAHDLFPAWSSDGKRIAFASNRHGAYNIHVMNADGSDETTLTNERKGSKFSCMTPTWSPDGERIAYVRQEGSNSTLISVQTDGDRERILAESAWDPAWSPAGDKIVFTSLFDNKDWKLYTVEPDGGNLKMILDMTNKVGFVYPAWSPDGKQLALTAQVDKGYELHVCQADGSNLKPLTKLGRMHTHAAWSADGKSVYSKQDTNGTLWRWIQTNVADGQSSPLNQTQFPPAPYLHGGRVAARPVVKP